jgi:hypothetical protein
MNLDLWSIDHGRHSMDALEPELEVTLDQVTQFDR